MLLSHSAQFTYVHTCELLCGLTPTNCGNELLSSLANAQLHVSVVCLSVVLLRNLADSCDAMMWVRRLTKARFMLKILYSIGWATLYSFIELIVILPLALESS